MAGIESIVGPGSIPALPLFGGTLTATSSAANIFNLVDPAISNASITSGFAGGSFSQAEYLFQNNGSGINVLSVQNNNAQGFSAYTVRATDVGGYYSERAAFGYSQNTGYSAAGETYIEYSCFPSPAIANFTGVIAAGVLTVSAVSGGTIRVGSMICGVNISSQFPTLVTSLGTGTGGNGTYNVSGTVTAASSAMTAGSPAGLKLIRTGFSGGINTTKTQAHFSQDGHIWFNKFSGNTTFSFDPTNGWLALSSNADAVAPLDVFGNAIFGNGSQVNRATNATFPITVDDTSGNVFRGIKDTVVKFDMTITGSGATRQLNFVDTDNSSVVPLALALTGTGIVKQGGGQINKTRVITAAGAITAATSDFIILANKTIGAATTVNLFATPTTGTVLYIKDGKGDASANNITITPAAGTIDGAATLVLNTNYAAAQLVYNGTEWNVI